MNFSSIQIIITAFALHTAAEPTLRAAVKTVLSYRNDMIIVIFLTTKKNKYNTKVALASSNSLLENSRLNLTKNNIFCLK